MTAVSAGSTLCCVSGEAPMGDRALDFGPSRVLCRAFRSSAAQKRSSHRDGCCPWRFTSGVIARETLLLSPDF